MSGTLWKGILFVDIACGELSWEMAFVIKIIMKTLLIRGDVSISIWAVINATGYGASIKPDKDLPSHLTSVICTLSFLQRKPISLGQESQTSWIRYEHFVRKHCTWTDLSVLLLVTLISYNCCIVALGNKKLDFINWHCLFYSFCFYSSFYYYVIYEASMKSFSFCARLHLL